MKVALHNGFKRHGFTLMELMVVLVLIAIVSAVTIPEMRGTYEDAILRSVSRELINALKIATSRAITSQQTCRMQFDHTTGRYELAIPARAGLGGNAYVPLRNVAGGEGKIDSHVAVEFRKSSDERQTDLDPDAAIPSNEETPTMKADESISFYSDGTADACEIQLQDRDGFRLGLRINPVTARVRIIELPRK